jgi:two-component system CheB/CheR fusion protein
MVIPVRKKKASVAPRTPPDDTPATVVACPVVGIGASAGGLAAFEAFFAGIPAGVDPGMAFVLVQHLVPDHDSLLASLIQRCTSMRVFEVEDGMRVQPNCAYIIPPGRDMAYLNGALQLLEPSLPHGRRLPIDFFFQSLAQDQHARAIGIVLSGSGQDGTAGVRAIKAEGGMVMAQIPASAEFDGMPRSALDTGLVDYALPPADMAAQLIAYVAVAFGAVGGRPNAVAVQSPEVARALEKVFVLIRARTGRDFSHYKPSTIERRIARRMAVHQIDALDAYVKFLQQAPAEVDALFRDLLISVTSFFRDPDVFQLLEREVVPALFADRSTDSVVRVWVPGCATGEEAYSLAILLTERMETLRERFAIQVFATDIDRAAIEVARAGVYPASIATDVSPERLHRFFVAQDDGSSYRVRASLRDMLIFSEQDVTTDPPIGKRDLISCRNLLIYLSAASQKRLIPLFHYALRPGGFLVLGTSESKGDFSALFTAVDRRLKVYRRADELPGVRRAIRPPLLNSPMTVPTPDLPGRTPTRNTMKRPLREMTEQALLAQLVAAGALVTAYGDILYLHGRSGLYLELAAGETGANNIVTMAREGLGPPLAAALHSAVITQEASRRFGLRVKTNGHFTSVNLTVLPVANGMDAPSGSPLYVVLLQESTMVRGEPSRPEATPEATPRGDAAVTDGVVTDVVTGVVSDVATASPASTREVQERLTVLTRALRAKDENLLSMQEELQSSAEELKSAVDELQFVNRELQSTNEELETAKEEMQSINEELTTVNSELQTRVGELTRVNDDISNLMAGTGIGSVFVDHDLRILRFTPAARAIINLIPGDVGRPVAHVVSNFVGDIGLVGAVREVLDTLIPKEAELQTVDGSWYLMRILPYRRVNNLIDGAVISFININETVRIRESLRAANDLLRLAVVVRDAHDAITVQDLTGRMMAWNPGAVRMYGWSEAEALAMNAGERIPRELRPATSVRMMQLARSEILEPYATQRLNKAGDAVNVTIVSTALINEQGQMYAIATTERASGGGTS